MALIKLMLILPFCLFAIFQLIGCDEHVRKRKDSRQGKSKSLSINLIIRYQNLNMIMRKMVFLSYHLWHAQMIQYLRESQNFLKTTNKIVW